MGAAGSGAGVAVTGHTRVHCVAVRSEKESKEAAIMLVFVYADERERDHLILLC